MALYVGNKKYCVIKDLNTKTQDILITQNGNYVPDLGFTGFSVVRVQVPEAILDLITIEPKVEQQIIEPIHDGYSTITVNPVTAEIDENIKPENIKKDVSILGVVGSFEYLLEELTVNPSLQSQEFISEKDGYSKVIVNPVTSDIDGNILAENIKEGITILGVEGKCIESNTTTRNIDDNGVYVPEAPYNGFSEVVVNIQMDLTPLIITPSTEEQIFGDEEKWHYYSPITVEAVTAEIDPNISETNIRKGITILGVEGTCEESITKEIVIKDNGVFTPDLGFTGFSKVTVDVHVVNNEDIIVTPSIEEQNLTPQDPYTGFGHVQVKPINSEIDSNLIPENIKEGVTLFGVLGTMRGSVVNTKELTIRVDKTTTTIKEFNVTEDFDGWSKVTLDLSWIENELKAINAGDVEKSSTLYLQDKTLTASGSYTCDDGFDGLGTVTVDLSDLEQQIADLKSHMVTATVDDFVSGSGSSFSSDSLFIREYCCYYYANLEEVTLNVAETIGLAAFANSGLNKLTINTSKVCTLASASCLDGTPIANGIGNIYVPAELVEDYKKDSNWIIYADRISAIS